jgi:hypothetical protein
MRWPAHGFATTNARSDTSIATPRPALAHRNAADRQVIEHASLRDPSHRS